MTIPFRVGCGYDVHAFTKGRKLFLGGVEVPHSHGLEGHSDADVVLHALCDALLGAAGAGDIGRHFPDTDPQYRGIASMVLLERVQEVIRGRGFSVGNVDITIVAQEPKLKDVMATMEERIGRALQIEPEDVNVKATTADGLGFEGRREGIAAFAVVCLTKDGKR